MNESMLPKVERDYMNVVTIITDYDKSRRVKTHLRVYEEINGSVDITPVYARIVTIDDERILGFMPSKIWCSNEFNQHFTLLYYVSHTLPLAVRPFKGNTYLMWFPLPVHTLQYEIGTRLYIDQIKIDDTMFLAVLFDDDTYPLVVDE